MSQCRSKTKGCNKTSKENKLVDVYNCARCEKNHKQLNFKRFSKNPIFDSDMTLWDYWTLCPTTNDPILLKTQE